MNPPTTSCPDPAKLKALLDGTLPGSEEAQLQSHVDTCPSCQHSLESLVAGKESWSGAAEQLGRNEQEPEANLERVIEQVKNEGRDRQEEAEAPPGEDISLDFLDPPENSSHLGRLGHYDVFEVIGRGGMGVVLKAFDSVLRRIVAIKVLAPQLATSSAARKRFEREARAAAAVSHEHIVAIHAVEETKGLPYLVMEYIAGVSLQERLDRTGPLELKEILRIGMQTARGLAAAHAQGLVHRDIKPANILLHNGVERVKITDFGLARAIDDASTTQSGYVAGTPQYMAPEQARGETVDHRADLFSLGSVLYALCTGRPPFRASTTMAVLKRVSEETARPLAEINPDLPAWLIQIIEKLHAKHPAERFQSAQAVADMLADHLARLQQPSAESGEREARSAERMAPRAPRSTLRAPRLSRVAVIFLPLIAAGLVLTEATGLTQIREWAATVLRISTAEGTLIVEIDDPQVQMTVDGEEIAIHGAGPQEIRLKAGQHRIQAMKDGKPVPVDKDLVTITRGGKQIVRVQQESAKPVAKEMISQLNKEQLPEVEVQHPKQVEATPVSQFTGRLVGPARDPIGISFEMDEGSFLNYQRLMREQKGYGPGSPLSVGLLNEQDFPHRGRITSFSDRLDPKNGSMEVHGTMPNPGRLLVPGLSVRVKMPFGPQRKGLVIPSRAILWDSSTDVERYVLVVNHKDIVERRTVKPITSAFVAHERDVNGKDILHFAEGEVLISDEGLNPADSVVVPKPGPFGLQGTLELRRLKPGTRVKPRLVEQKTTGSGSTVEHPKAPATALRQVGSQNLSTPYKIEPFHVLKVNVLDVDPSHPIQVGNYLVEPDGKIDLGLPYRKVKVSGLTLEKAEDTVRNYLKGLGFSQPKVSLSLAGWVPKWLGGPAMRAPFRIRPLQLLSVRALDVDPSHPLAGEYLIEPSGKINFGPAYGRVPLAGLTLEEAQNAIEKHLKKLGFANPIVSVTLGGWQKDWHDLRKQDPGRNAGKQDVKSPAQLQGGRTESVDIATLHGHTGPVLSLAFSPDGKTVISTGGPRWDKTGQGQICFWHLYTGGNGFIGVTRYGNSIFEKSAVRSVAISQDGTTLATGEDDGTAIIREADRTLLQWRFVLDGHNWAVTSLAFAPDSQTLATGGENNIVKIWRLNTRDVIEILETGFKHGVRCIAYSPDGKTLAVGGKDAEGGTSKLFDVASWNTRSTLKGHKAVVSSVTFSPDSKMVATGSLDGTVKLWNAVNSNELVTLNPQSGQIYSAVFSPDGKLLATAGEDKTVKLWDVPTRRELTTLKGHMGPVDTVAFSPDGKILASGSTDRTVRLWNVPAALAGAESPVKVTLIPIRHTDPMKLADLVKERLGDAASKVAITVDIPTRTLIMSANAEQTKQIKEIIQMLDVESSAPTQGSAERVVPEAKVQHPKEIEVAAYEQYTGRLVAPEGDPIGLAFEMDERSYLRFQRLCNEHKIKVLGSRLYVGLAGENGFPHQGKLMSIHDRVNPATGTVRVEGIMPNPGRILLPGIFVRIRLPFGPPQKALAVPVEAVHSEDGQHYVLVVNDKDIVERRDVTAGEHVFAGGKLRIIQKGLAATDRIVITRYYPKLIPGTHVKPRIVGD
jgi:WD40 repeat protein/multidrug efflux pump subunit AcrA (membrane-fusion protein)/protein involved in polysaccharide export with SLBB domain/anti-sigma factor RsiW